MNALPETLVTSILTRFDPERVKPGRWKQDAEITIFVHIPKTAGSAIFHTLNGAYDLTRSLRYGQVKQDLDIAWEEAKAAQAQSDTPLRQVLIGHANWNQFKHLMRGAGRPMLITVIRNPADRLVSQYAYNSSEAHPKHQNFRREFPTFEAFLDSVPPNSQLNQLVGRTGGIERQLERLAKRYRFVGVTEHFSASLDHLAVSHGFPEVTEYVANVGKTAKRGASLTPEMRTAICERHMGDWILYTLLEPAMARHRARLARVRDT
nr:sulfotransferase family 2 domain-containing protein [Maritimibacter dapengensis]